EIISVRSSSYQALRARFSPLPLLVARIRADDPDHALAADDLALAADSLYRCTYFHRCTPWQRQRRRFLHRAKCDFALRQVCQAVLAGRQTAFEIRLAQQALVL